MDVTWNKTLADWGALVARFVEGELCSDERATLEAAAQSNDGLQALICAELALRCESDDGEINGEPMRSQIRRCGALLAPDAVLSALRSSDFTLADKHEIVHSVVSMYLMGDEENYIALIEQAGSADIGFYAFDAKAELQRRSRADEGAEVELPMFRAGYSTKHYLRSFLGLNHPLERSVVLLPTFRGDRWDLSATAAPLPYGSPFVDVATARKRRTFRFATALGDLMAAQQVQRLCDEGHIAPPILGADGMEQMDWDLPSHTPVPSSTSRPPKERHQFVVGICSNSHFVRLYEEKLKHHISLTLIPGEGDAPDSVWLGLPERKDRTGVAYYSPLGAVYDDDLAGMISSEETGFIIYGRVRHGKKSYFLLGGDSEPHTFLAGAYLRSHWARLWSLVDCDESNDFLIALRVDGTSSSYETEWPRVSPLLVWRERRHGASILDSGVEVSFARE